MGATHSISIGVRLNNTLKSYFGDQAKKCPVSNNVLEKAKNIMRTKIKLTTFKEDSYYDLSQGLNLAKIDDYARVHADMLDLESEKDIRKFRNYISKMASELNKGEHKWEHVDFQVRKFMFYFFILKMK